MVLIVGIDFDQQFIDRFLALGTEHAQAHRDGQNGEQFRRQLKNPPLRGRAPA
ncbi:hypothetical protein [Polaromonas sp. AER18D-145]|uniref:hypothetical protein n=1 Tax=Polaromonas sp. AER18D-145 TaxID=1977060 RepID=UPI0014828E1B